MNAFMDAPLRRGWSQATIAPRCQSFTAQQRMAKKSFDALIFDTPAVL
jgi:hypothetical protein